MSGLFQATLLKGVFKLNDVEVQLLLFRILYHVWCSVWCIIFFKKVSYKFYMNCTSSYVSVATGIHEATSNALNLFPNPAHSLLNYHSDADINQITITDVAGKMIRQLSASGSDGQIAIGDLVDGLYFVRLQSRNGSAQTLRFTKDWLVLALWGPVHFMDRLFYFGTCTQWKWISGPIIFNTSLTFPY